MAKAAAPKLTGDEANEAAYQMVVTGEQQPISMEEAFDIVEATDREKMVDLSSSYLKLELGKHYVFFVRGVRQERIKEKMVDVAVMENKEGQQLLGGDKLLVDACKQLKQLPCFIKVFYKGDAKSPMGSYKQLEISTFEANIK